MKRILFTAGGTGGSLTPLLAVATYLREREPESDIRFLVTKNPLEHDLLRTAGFSAQSFPAGKFRRYFSIANLVDAILVLAAFFRALLLFFRWRPGVVASAGSFLSPPIAWAAWLHRIPVAIHQQDIQPGLANRMMAPFSTRITAAYATPKQRFGKKKILVTGNPLRAGILEGSAERARNQFGIDDGLPIVLLLGGSTGSRALSELITVAQEALCQRVHVVHVLGKNGVLPAQTAERYHPVAFLARGLEDLYAAATVVVTRAGIGTLSELAALNKPAIIIPMPDTHQEANAEYFAMAGAALVLEQRHLTPAKFSEHVLSLVERPEEQERYAKALHALVVPEATANVARVLQDCLGT